MSKNLPHIFLMLSIIPTHATDSLERVVKAEKVVKVEKPPPRKKHLNHVHQKPAFRYDQ